MLKKEKAGKPILALFLHSHGRSRQFNPAIAHLEVMSIEIINI